MSNETPESGELSERLVNEGLDSSEIVEYEERVDSSEDTVTNQAEPKVVLPANLDSIKSIIRLGAGNNLTFMRLDRELKLSFILSRTIYLLGLMGLVFVIYQALLHSGSPAEIMAPLSTISVVLISGGMFVTVFMLDNYVNVGLLDSMFPEKRNKSFSGSWGIAPVGLLMWIVGVVVSVRSLSADLSQMWITNMDTVASGLQQMTAGQALGFLPLGIYSAGVIVGIVYLVQSWYCVHVLRKNSNNIQVLAEVTSGQYVKITAED